MLKSKQPPQPPPKAPPPKPRRDHKHWSQRIQETVVSAVPEESLNIFLVGGADNGQFCYVGDVKHEKIAYHSGKLHVDEIILEIQGQKLAGYTLRDATMWLKQVSQNGAPVMIKTVKTGLLPKDLRQFLNARFQKGSIDHDLQQTIRDNLYLRTVPCTTRGPRPGELNGVDYTFLSMEEFQALEKSGNLLESGIYDGNHYGTPKPPHEPKGPLVRRTSSAGSLLPGAHPSSDGKRKRNRSNVEAQESRTTPVPFNDEIQGPPPPFTRKKSLERAHSSGDLGPLPPNWEMAYTEEGHPYFIDHETETTHWLDPRLASLQKQVPSDCDDNELPYGWEKVEDPHYGTYYIDHVNRRTQYENPVTQAKRSQTPGNDLSGTSTFPRNKKFPDSSKRSASDSAMNGQGPPPDYSYRLQGKQKPNIARKFSKKVEKKRVFTKNPAELKGERFQTSLVKSVRGFGFTIIGGDRADEEFLQIKNVVPNGPAYQDGNLRTGDVIVYVNEQCVLGFTHQDVVGLFQKITPGQTVTLEICRGYSLPFDPDDPNTEIITTQAVSLPPEGASSDLPPSYSQYQDMDRHNTSVKSLKSLPDLARSANVNLNPNSSFTQPGGGGNGIHNDNTPDVLTLFQNISKPEILRINIVRGEMGFGFTIADSAYGQKVKQILDKPRCKNLQEGDLLQEINGIKVANMSHSEIVQVLKDCPKGQETAIVVQRGGIPSKNKKQLKSPTRQDGGGNLPLDSSFGSNQPGAYFFTGGEGHNQSNVSENLDQTDAATSDRTKTPNMNDGRPKTPSGGERPKTPTRTMGMMVDGRGKPPLGNRPPLSEMQNVRVPTDAHIPRKEYTPQDENSRENGSQGPDLNQSRTSDFYNSSGSYDFNSRPPPGPRFDQFRQDFRHKTDNVNRQDGTFSRTNPMHNFLDRDPRYDYGREQAKPGQFRSRTPGPELMARSPGTEFRHEFHRPKTPTAHDMRSKTPQPGMTYGYAPGGNPEFMRFQDSWGDNRTGYNGTHRTWGPTIPEYPGSPPLPRRNEDVFNHDRRFGNNPLHPQGSPRGTVRPSRQSTSFETEEPTPSNITRVPRRFQSNSFGNQSPRPPRFLEREDSLRYVEMTVTLPRQDSGFGFRIIGGTEEGSQVSVGHIVPGGAADVEGKLRTGDEIIYVQGMCVVHASHHKVVQLMGNAAMSGHVTLGIRRRIPPSTDSFRGGGLADSYPYDIVVSRRENEGFGFVIISSVTKAGSTIGRILENSPAERCGKLHIGDRILAVNGVDISLMHHEDIVNLIKDSGYSVNLTIGPPQDDTSSNASTSQRSSQGSMINAMAYPAVSESDLSRRSEPSPFHQAPDRYHQPMLPERGKDMRRGFPNHQGPDEEIIYSVELHRGSRGFGFSIRGGQEFSNMPLFVLRIAEGGAADQDGRLRVGDQLLEINGYNTDSMTHSEAIDIIQNGGSTVQLLVKRTGKPPPNFDPNIPASGRYTPGMTMANGPIGQSSPYLGRRNPPPERDEYFYNYPVSRSYPNY